MGRPQLLVLDEPTEGIQPSIILEIEAAVRRIIKTTGISVLLVEQHLHFVRQADRYYAMQKGGILASGATSELSQDVIQQLLAVWIGVSIQLSAFSYQLQIKSKIWGKPLVLAKGDAILLNYLELKSISQRSQLTEEVAAELADEIDSTVWPKVKSKLYK